MCARAECIFFVSKDNTHTNTNKQKAKETEKERRKAKETKRGKKKENIAVVNGIQGFPFGFD